MKLLVKLVLRMSLLAQLSFSSCRQEVYSTKSKCFSSHMAPLDGTDLHFCSIHPDTSLHCKTMDMCLGTPQLLVSYKGTDYSGAKQTKSITATLYENLPGQVA